MNKKISIIIPCYNTEKYIDRCLNSVVSQTIGIDHLEVICVDDASTDSTYEKLLAWEQKYKENILVIHCKENGRQGCARNIALSYATGAYITFLDSDDWMELDAYEKMYHAMKTYACDIVRCKMIRDPDQINIWTHEQKRDNHDVCIEITDEEERKKLIVSDIMDHLCCNKMYSRDLIFKYNIYFPEKCFYEDIFFGVLHYLYANRIYLLNEKLYHYFINEKSTVMKKEETYHMDRFKVVSKLWEEFKSRNVLSKYQKELELNFLVHYFLNGIRMLAICYKHPTLDQFQTICDGVKTTIPDYQSNPYIQDVLDDMCQLQIALIDKNISESEFDSLIALLQKNGTPDSK